MAASTTEAKLPSGPNIVLEEEIEEELDDDLTEIESAPFRKGENQE